jgi:hypothetical protein
LTQLGWQSTLSKDRHSPFAKFPQIQLFGTVMLDIKIPARSPKASTGSHGLEPTRSVTGSSILAFIDEAFDHQYRMSPSVLPIRIEPFEAQAQHPRGQVGILMAIRQNKKTTIVDDKTQSSRPLTCSPPNPIFTRLDIQRRSAESDQCNPFSVEFSDIA